MDDNILHSNYGIFVLIHGSMFSGKTEELVSTLYRAEKFAKRNVQAFKPVIDHRYGINAIKTHEGLSYPAVEVNNASEIYGLLKPNVDVIGIEEIQFLDDKIIDFCIEQRANGKIVLAAGLLSDFETKLFKFKDSEKNMGDLLAHANYSIQKTAFCFMCGKPALYTMRKTESKDLVVIGGAEAYVASCPEHHNVLQK
jgi:thymidine kinase